MTRVDKNFVIRPVTIHGGCSAGADERCGAIVVAKWEPDLHVLPWDVPGGLCLRHAVEARHERYAGTLRIIQRWYA